MLIVTEEAVIWVQMLRKPRSGVLAMVQRLCIVRVVHGDLLPSHLPDICITQILVSISHLQSSFPTSHPPEFSIVPSATHIPSRILMAHRSEVVMMVAIVAASCLPSCLSEGSHPIAIWARRTGICSKWFATSVEPRIPWCSKGSEPIRMGALH
jgi:hypothetical protein